MKSTNLLKILCISIFLVSCSGKSPVLSQGVTPAAPQIDIGVNPPVSNDVSEDESVNPNEDTVSSENGSESQGEDLGGATAEEDVSEAYNNSESNSPTVTPKDENYTISPVREYGPSGWDNVKVTFNGSGVVSIPSEVNVLTGNPGTGWMSVTLKNAKYCYQGNARNNNEVGSKFKLVKSYSSGLGRPCHQNSPSHNLGLDFSVSSGDEMHVSIDGGGCGKDCQYTEVEFNFYFSE